jgi:hypothetical protein
MVHFAQADARPVDRDDACRLGPHAVRCPRHRAAAMPQRQTKSFHLDEPTK